MGLPKINAAFLDCPRCSRPAQFVGITKVDFPAGNRLFSFECHACGEFDVLALVDEIDQPERHLARPGAESQDLWL